jgi:O-antigen/teichoic acid export membrane protein
VVAIVAILSFIADGGISQFIIKELSQCRSLDEQARFYRNSQGVQLITSIVILTLTIATASFININGEFVLILLLGSGAALSGYLTNSFLYFVANQNIRFIFIKDLITAAARVALTLIGVFYKLPITYFCAINLIIACLLLLFIIRLKRNFKFQHLLEFSLNSNFLVRFLNSSWPYTLTALFNIFYNKIDILILKNIADINQVAYYAGATQFIYPFMFISSALITALYPMLSKNAHTNHDFENIRRLSTYILCIVGLSLSVFLFFSSNFFFEMAFKGKFDNSLPVFKMLVWYLAIVFLYGSYSNPIMAKNGIKFLLMLNITMVFVKVFINIMLIPLYGALGASFSSIICELVICVAMISYYHIKVVSKEIAPL